MRTSQSNSIIAISLGDPGGIGSEVTVKALADERVRNHPRIVSGELKFVLFGAFPFLQKSLDLSRKKIDIDFKAVPSFDAALRSGEGIPVVDIAESVEDVKKGQVAEANALISYRSLERVTELALKNKVKAIVTASINKEAVRLIEPGFTGHTEYLAREAGTDSFAMMLAGGALRVVLVTTHCPLSEVASKLSVEKIIDKIRLTYGFLKNKMDIASPRVGVAALNPHAGEGGKIGKEEKLIIEPAVARAGGEGFPVEGPIPADIIFHEAYEGRLDAVVAMYHDQALGPLKMTAFHTGVNITLGLPFIRTSPDHGTAFDIAYTDSANAGSMTEALLSAIELV